MATCQWEAVLFDSTITFVSLELELEENFPGYQLPLKILSSPLRRNSNDEAEVERILLLAPYSWFLDEGPGTSISRTTKCLFHRTLRPLSTNDVVSPPIMLTRKIRL